MTTTSKFFTSLDEAKKTGPQNLSSGILNITVLEARDLIPIDKFSTVDPYVILQLGNNRFQTDIIFNSLNPFFNESFSIPVENWRESTLYICVVHDNSHAISSASDEENIGIGNSDIHVESIVGRFNSDEVLETWIKLNDVETGYLKLGFQFSKKVLD